MLAARDATSQARLDQALAEVNRNLLANPGRAAAGLQTALSEVQTTGERNGMSSGEIAEAQRQTRASALADGVEHAIDGRAGLDQIQRLHDQVRGQMDPVRAEAIDGWLDRLRAQDAAGRAAPGVIAGDTDAAPPRDLGEALARGQALAGDDPQRQSAFDQAIAEHWSQAQQDRMAQRQSGISALQPRLLDPSIRSMADLPRAEAEFMPKDSREAAAAFYAGGGQFPRQSDPATAYELMRRMSDDPDSFAALDPTAYAGKLSRADYISLLQQQADARAESPGFRIQQLQARRTLAIADHALAGADPQAAADPDRAAAFHDALQQSIELFQHDNPGKTPNDAQLTGMAQALADRQAGAGRTASIASGSLSHGILHGARFFVSPDGDGNGEAVADDGEEDAAPDGGSADSSDPQSVGDAFAAASGADEVQAAGLQKAAWDHETSSSSSAGDGVDADGEDDGDGASDATPATTPSADKSSAAGVAAPVKTKDSSQAAESKKGASGHHLTFADQTATAKAVVSAAHKYGLDPKEMLTWAYVESTLDAKADDRRHHGLFQFSFDAFKEAKGDTTKIMNVDEQVRVFKQEQINIKGKFKKRFGRLPEPWEAYMVHQQGWTGTIRLMTGDKNKLAIEVRLPGVNWRTLDFANNPILRNIPNSKPNEAGPTTGQYLAMWRARYASKATDAEQVNFKLDKEDSDHISNLTGQALRQVLGVGPQKTVGLGTSEQFMAVMKRSVDKFGRDTKGLAPDDVALTKMGDTLLLPGHWMEGGQPVRGHLFQAPRNSTFFYDIDDASRARISDAFQTKFARLPTASELGTIYARQHADRLKQ
jgi:hypothetical protein